MFVFVDQTTNLTTARHLSLYRMNQRYWLADSWWYYKGVKDGVKNWTAMPSIFPRGLEYLYEKTGWTVQGHNRFWSENTDYAKQNGGKWNFLMDTTGGGSQYVTV